MRLISRLLCASLFLLLTALLVSPVAVFAAGSQGGIGIAPAHTDPNNPATRAYFIRAVAPGGSFSDQVIVSNSTTSPIQFYVNAVDGLTSPASGAVYANRQDPVRKAGLWVTPDVSVITVPGPSRTLVGFTVHVPAAAVPGDHLAGIAFENAKTTTTGGGAIAVTTVFRLVIGVLVQVPGPAAFHLRIDGVSIQPLPGFGTASVIVTLVDDGLLLGKPLLEVRVKGDHYDRTISRQLDTLLPDDVIPFALPWPDGLAPGAYQVTVTGSGAGLSDPVSFVATVHLGQEIKGTQPTPRAPIPWWLLAAAAALGVGIAVGWLAPRLSRKVRRPTPARARGIKPSRSKAAPAAKQGATQGATHVAMPGLLIAAAAPTASPGQETLASIEVEVTPRRLRFVLSPGQRFSFGEEGEMIAEVPLTAEEERRVLEAAHALAVSNRVWETAGDDADRAFSSEALEQASLHVRLGFDSGLRWATWYPIASVPPNLRAFCDGLHDLGTRTLDRQASEFLAQS